MEFIGIRGLQRRVTSIIAQVASGETVVVTDHGRPVAQIVPLPRSPFDQMLAAGLIRPARRRLQDLPPPVAGGAVDVAAMRENERY